MKKSLRFLWTALTLSLCAVPSIHAADLAIVNARIYVSPDERPIERGAVVVRDGRIAAIGATVKAPRGVPVIDAAGLTIAAGFWNSHVHLLPDRLDVTAREPKELERQLRDLFVRWGFTTVFDVASPLDNTLALRERIESGAIDGPRVLTTGNPFFPMGGTPIYIREMYHAHGWNDEVATPDEAHARAGAQLARGADGVKVFTGAIVGPPQGVLPMRTDIAAAAVAAAHEARKPSFTHPTDPRGILIALEAGVTVLTHNTPTEGPWPDKLVRKLVEHRVALVPTLTLLDVALAEEGAPASVRDRMMADGQQQVRALAAAGGDILFGTDVGFIAEADTTHEVRLMAGAGLDHVAILRSLTTAPAARFGGPGRSGRIAVGEQADLVLLGSDPAQNVDAFADVRCTIRDGRVIYAAASHTVLCKVPTH